MKPFHEIPVIILCAGLGTRLKPLTEHTPKPLIKILNHEILYLILEYYYQLGFRKFCINTYHLKKSFVEFKNQHSRYDITLFEEEELLDSGGGIKNILLKLNVKVQFALVLNGDTLLFLKKSQIKNMILKLEKRMGVVLCVSKNLKLYSSYKFLEKSQYHVSSQFHFQQSSYHFFGAQLMSVPYLNTFFQSFNEKKFSILKFYSQNKVLIHLEAIKNEWYDIGTLHHLAYTSILILKKLDSKKDSFFKKIYSVHQSHFDIKNRVFLGSVLESHQSLKNVIVYSSNQKVNIVIQDESFVYPHMQTWVMEKIFNLRL